MNPGRGRSTGRSRIPRTQILAHSILAANGHNLQSWRFVYAQDHPNAFDAYLETGA